MLIEFFLWLVERDQSKWYQFSPLDWILMIWAIVRSGVERGALVGTILLIMNVITWWLVRGNKDE